MLSSWIEVLEKIQEEAKKECKAKKEECGNAK